MRGRRRWKRRPFASLTLACACVLLLLPSCSSGIKQEREVKGDPFSSGHLLQSGANRFANLTMRDNMESLRILLDKLYKRNPSMWRKTGAASLENAREAVMTSILNNAPFPEAQITQRSVDALRLAMAPTYEGDRAGLLIYGLGTMLIEAYGGRVRLYLIHGLNPQMLANAAHNTMVASWLLNSRRDGKGVSLLLSDEINPEARNLSFAREFGKIIGRLDTLAALVDERYARSVIDYGQGLVGGTLFQFIPVDALSSALSSGAVSP